MKVRAIVALDLSGDWPWERRDELAPLLAVELVSVKIADLHSSDELAIKQAEVQSIVVQT